MYYVLIVVTMGYNGTSVSQQEYRTEQACEIAASTVKDMVVDIRGAAKPTYWIRTSCVSSMGRSAATPG